MQRGCRLYSHMAQRWTSLTARMQVCSTHWIHDLADFVRYAYRSRLAQAGMLQTGLTHNRNVARFTSTTLIISKLAAVTATPYEWATFVLCGNARQLALGNDTSTPLMPLDQWTDILKHLTIARDHNGPIASHLVFLRPAATLSHLYATPSHACHQPRVANRAPFYTLPQAWLLGESHATACIH